MYDWMGKGWNSNVSGLEKLMDNTIFVYPDQKYVWQDNNGKDIKGWALGDYAAPFNGNHDIQFTKELLELIQKAIPLIVIAFLQQDIPGVGI